MRMKIFQWLCFGVICSAIPLVFALFFYHTMGSEVEELEYVPDLILVSFAVAVNAFGSIFGRNAKNEFTEGFCMFLSVVSMLFCFAGYFILVGYVINLNEELYKLEILTEENSEIIEEIVSDIRNALKRNNEEIKWPIYKGTSLLLILINTLIVIIVEIKQFRKRKKKRTSTKITSI